MRKPLWMPPGSVRALLLLALAARAVLDLRAERGIAPWLAATLIICAAAYFSARSASAQRAAAGGAPPDPLAPGDAPAPARTRHPLGLPAGWVRTIFLLAVAYGAWLFFKSSDTGIQDMPLAWILGAFFLGVVMRLLLRKARRPEDFGTHWGWHLQALTVILAVAGLIVIAALDTAGSVPDWVQPVLAAGPVYYFATR